MSIAARGLVVIVRRRLPKQASDWRQQIGRMKRTARLINLARGSLLDEAALLNALHNGALAVRRWTSRIRSLCLPDFFVMAAHPIFSLPAHQRDQRKIICGVRPSCF